MGMKPNGTVHAYLAASTELGCGVLMALGLLVPFALQYRANDQRENRVIEDFGRKVLEPLAPESVLIVSTDPGWTATRYVQVALGVRPDVAVVSQNLMSYDWFKPMEQRQYPRLRMPGTHYHVGKEAGFQPSGYGAEHYRTGGYSMREFLAANLAQGPVYIEGGFMPMETASLGKEFSTLPYGLVYRVVRTPEVGMVTAGDWAVRAQKPDVSGWRRFPEGSWEHFLYMRYK
jgi:hypothetical protein